MKVFLVYFTRVVFTRFWAFVDLLWPWLFRLILLSFDNLLHILYKIWPAGNLLSRIIKKILAMFVAAV